MANRKTKGGPRWFFITNGNFVTAAPVFSEKQRRFYEAGARRSHVPYSFMPAREFRMFKVANDRKLSGQTTLDDIKQKVELMPPYEQTEMF